MKIKSQRDFVAGAMFVAIGVTFAIGATYYAFGSSAKPGPGYFPLLLGVILALLGLAVVFGAITIERDDGDPIGSIAWKPLLWILGSVVAFGALLPRGGLAVAVPVLIVVSSLGGDEFHWKGVLAMSVVLAVGSWLVFVKGLGLIIPLWPTFVGG